MPRQISVDLPEKLARVFEHKKKYRGAYGGRGSGKTRGMAKMAVTEMLSLYNGKPWKFLCGRELQKSLKDSVFSVISSEITNLGLEDKFEVGKEFIRAKNGNEFLFYGLRSNISEVKGLNDVRRTWLEEAQAVSQSSLDYLIPTVMRDFPDCEIWASWNPSDEEDPVHQMFVENSDESFACEKINYVDNPWFPESLNEVRLRDKKFREGKYDWIWNGNFNTNSDGSVYGKWLTKLENEGRLKEGIYDPSLPVFTAWDLGYSDDTAIWWFQVAGNEVRLIDYYENNREDMRHYAEQLHGRNIVDLQYGPNGKIISYRLGSVIEGLEHRVKYKYDKHYVPHDAANKLLAAGGRSIVEQLHELGIKSLIVAATSQQNQINAGRILLDHAWIDPVLCKTGVRAIRKYQFIFDEDRNKYSDKPDHDGFSHACDAMEVVAQIWKSAKVEQKPEKPRFLNEITVDEIFYGNTSNNATGYNRI